MGEINEKTVIHNILSKFRSQKYLSTISIKRLYVNRQIKIEFLLILTVKKRFHIGTPIQSKNNIFAATFDPIVL